MSANKPLDNVKLGFFVSAGVLFLVLSLYLIGRNQSLFGPTLSISARFKNISGLVSGNNVRYAGIDVGTVKSIDLTSDSDVLVVMLIDKKARPYIKQNAMVSIGTDGLIGNKLVNITPRPGFANSVENGSVLVSDNPIETEAMLRTLKNTNDNIAVITGNLKDMSVRLNSNNSLWSILADSTLAHDLRKAAAHLSQAGANAEYLTKDAHELVSRFTNGNGVAQSLFADTLLRRNLEQSVANIQEASKQIGAASSGLNEVINNMRSGKGMAGVLLSDSASAERMRQSIISLEKGLAKFDEDMEAMKHNFLTKGYFKDQEKERKKELEKQKASEKK